MSSSFFLIFKFTFRSIHFSEVLERNLYKALWPFQIDDSSKDFIPNEKDLKGPNNDWEQLEGGIELKKDKFLDFLGKLKF